MFDHSREKSETKGLKQPAATKACSRGWGGPRQHGVLIHSYIYILCIYLIYIYILYMHMWQTYIVCIHTVCEFVCSPVHLVPIWLPEPLLPRGSSMSPSSSGSPTMWDSIWALL